MHGEMLQNEQMSRIGTRYAVIKKRTILVTRYINDSRMSVLLLAAIQVYAYVFNKADEKLRKCRRKCC